MTDATAPACEGCPWNPATHVARRNDVELHLCECCAGTHDAADGWSVTPMAEPPLLPHAGDAGW
jgi:protein-arginine kinase activator protein McsA